MTHVTSDLDNFLGANDERIRNELFDFLRIPSVSARSEHDADTSRAAEWTADSLRAAGLEATVHSTAGHPVVVGKWRGAPEGAPTVLIYGHYDVQPAEPLELWTSPVRAHRARRPRLRPRLRGRQGTALPAHQGARGPPEGARQASRQRDRPRRGRRGGRQRSIWRRSSRRTPRSSSATPSSSPTRPCSRPGCRASCRRCAGWPTSRSTCRGRRRISIPAATAAPS